MPHAYMRSVRLPYDDQEDYEGFPAQLSQLAGMQGVSFCLHEDEENEEITVNVWGENPSAVDSLCDDYLGKIEVPCFNDMNERYAEQRGRLESYYRWEQTTRGEH